MSFGILFLISCANLIGPTLSGIRRLSLPLVVGEIGAGILIGKTGFNLVPNADPTLVFLSSVGFAMLMFLVGTHLPLRDPNLRKAFKHSVIATGLAFAISIPVGMLIAHLTGLATAIFVLILANSSAAVVMPILLERKLDGNTVLLTRTWVALADAVTIVALPLAMSTGKTVHVAMGAGIVTAAAVLSYFALSAFRKSTTGARYRKLSKDRGWALDLRLSTTFLFGLAWLGTIFGTSILVAGFAAGAVVSLIGKPKRFDAQLTGVAQGFFVPFFFVTLGAKLDVSALIHSVPNIELMLLICAATVVVHAAVAKLTKLPQASGLVACAQLGLPAAVVSIGMENGMLHAGQGAAIIGASLLSLLCCSLGAALLGRIAAAEVAKTETPA